MEIEYEINQKTVELYDEYGHNIVNIPTTNLLDFIEFEDLNLNGEVEDDFFEERNDDGGFSYTPVQVELRDNAFEYLENNTDDVVKSYLKHIIDNYEEYKKIS